MLWMMMHIVLISILIFFRLDKNSLKSKTGFSCYQHNTGFRFYDKKAQQMSIYDVGLVWNEDTNKLQVSYKTQSDDNNQSKVFRFNICGNYKDKNTGTVKKFYINSSDEDGFYSEGEEEVPFLCGFLINDRSRLVDAGSLWGSWYLDKSDDFKAEDHCTFDFGKKIKEGSYTNESFINYLKIKMFGKKDYEKHTISDAIEQGLLNINLEFIQAKDIDIF